MSVFFPEIALNLKRRKARTEELLSRSISLWDDLANTIQLSHSSIDEWKKKAEKLEGFNGLFFSAHLEVMKQHLEKAKDRRSQERPYENQFMRIPPSRLIKRV